MRELNPWHLVAAAVLATAVSALGRFLGVDPLDALVDAVLAGFFSFLILAWRRR